MWADAASEVDGSYFNLDQNQEIVWISTPYDDEISELNRQLNRTYIPYGNQGMIYYNRMETQDYKAKRSGSGIERSIAKSSSHYDNSSWDLVDAVSSIGFGFITQINRNSLPQNLRSLTTNEQKKYIDKTQQEREKIKAEIAELSEKRNKYIRKNTAKSEQKDTLDNLIIEALEKQLEAKGFEFLK